MATTTRSNWRHNNQPINKWHNMMNFGPISSRTLQNRAILAKAHLHERTAKFLLNFNLLAQSFYPALVFRWQSTSVLTLATVCVFFTKKRVQQLRHCHTWRVVKFSEESSDWFKTKVVKNTSSGGVWLRGCEFLCACPGLPQTRTRKWKITRNFRSKSHPTES